MSIYAKAIEIINARRLAVGIEQSSKGKEEQSMKLARAGTWNLVGFKDSPWGLLTMWDATSFACDKDGLC